MPTQNRQAQRGRVALGIAIRRYLRQIWIDRRVSLAGLFVPGLGLILTTYVPPLVIASILARYIEGGETAGTALLPQVLIFAGAWFAGEIVWRIGIHYLIRTSVYGIRALYTEALEALLDRDMSFFHDNFAGSLTKKASGYARHYEVFVDTLGFQVIGNLLPLPFVAFVLWRFSPVLVVILVAMTTLTFAISYPLIRRRQELVNRREMASNVVVGHVADSISNVEAVRANAAEADELRMHRRNVSDYAAKMQHSWDYSNQRIDVVTSPLYVLTNALGLFVAVSVAQSVALSVEAVFVTFSYYASFTRIMWDFHRILRQLESSLTEAAQFTELLLDPSVVNDPSSARPVEEATGTVEFRGVGFAHPGQPRLLTDFNLRIEDGERVGLVGRSGGGKTTLTRLLLRFMDVQEGAVLVGGHDVAKISQADLRALIAYVPQDPVMFHRSLADNIRFGRPEATDEEVAEAARLAHATEFIEGLPEGFATLVGERGVKLSGGQRQRIAIARAIVKNAPILVLDEATSSLDSESEGLIQEAIWELMKDRTAIVIAHRLATVRRMDRLIVLEHGHPVEEGTHDDLLASAGRYADLWERQSGGFLSAGASGAAS